ncbi:fatty acid-binding protein, muscle-like [Schistocerca cancellata]|uniref:fatty acid-binding protein, muscle-like n=1 Tax=Schistocerca cancellata TaxID=274614 RepID=UPI0021189812|nr:fatty acid-binding protein, muscle-like [Schistocerca cancellata]
MSLEECVGLRYKLDKAADDNFDEIMGALGVNYVLRKLGNMVAPVMELLRDGDEWTMKVTTVVLNTVTKFRLGQEFDNVTPDGRKVKTTVTREGNKLFIVERGDKVFKSVLEFSPEELVTVGELDNIVCRRRYKVIK